MRSIYFLSYAVITTISAMTMAWAYYARFKKDGSPINYSLLTLVSVVALAMWTGAAFTEFAYNVSPATAGFAAFFLGITFSAVFAWQVYLVMRNIQTDKNTIEELSTRDSLTGLWNRRIFHEYLSSEFSRATMYKQPLSLLMIDIDDLPQFNATYGFKNGDFVLRDLGSRMMESVRDFDRSCRFVDGVVAVILPKMGSKATIEFAEQIKSMMTDNPFNLEDERSVTLSFSVGIATFPEYAKDEDSLVAGVLSALNAARESGGDTIYLFAGVGECRRLSNSA